jgi:REP element-mobilizing transposase RayT
VRYFVTACTLERRRGLEERATTDQIIECARKSDALGDTATIALCVMPDHVHWLFELGGRLTLGRVIARLKADTRKNLTVAGLAWQRDFFEHRLRAEESAEDYARYVFLNPYRAGLVAQGISWRGWWCPRLESFEFSEHLNPDGSPPSEWIGEVVPTNLVVGE